MQFLFEPWRFKVCWGGRGSAKSWSIALVLIILAYSRKLRILCARELQTSIKDSVHKLLCDQIENLGLSKHFYVTETQIKCIRTGSEFFFRGIRRNAAEIKSMEAIDICWLEESQSISKESLDLLIPTVRKEGSEIWFSLNPLDASDEVYRRFIIKPPANAKVVKVNYTENPFFPQVLDDERIECLRRDPESYDNIWLGEPRKISQAQVFKPYDAVTGQGHYLIHEFDWCSALDKDEVVERDMVLYHGVDWGFANDPTIINRFFITGEGKEQELWVDMEASGVGIEINDLPTLFEKIPTSRRWKIYADCSRPETISYMSHQGFLIEGAEKWPGSVEDGIAHLKGFKCIHIHATNCPEAVIEARKYMYKVDKNGDILPVIVDAFNHFWDDARYALGKFIKRRDVGSKWKKMLGD
jgi:phage terminase large subunit